MYRGRFAPSPTGPLHVGNAFAAWVAWHRARGGELALRVEDIDTPRTVPGCETEQLADLAWLGITWNGPLVRQSERFSVYAQTTEALLARGLAYYCTCSRKQIAMASAPHGPEGPRYSGTCRGRREKPGAPYAVRFAVPEGAVTFTDALYGPQHQDVSALTGDFVIARADGVFAYQLAVVVDDMAMGISEVVRGADLLVSTPRQLLLYAALGAAPPAFCHVPLITAGGDKLSKREPRHTLGGLRALCVKPERLRERFADAWAEALQTAPLSLDIGALA
jgi:glutamyl-tRNA synthetase